MPTSNKEYDKLIKKIDKNFRSIPLIKKINKNEEYRIELWRFIPSNIFAAFIKAKIQNNVKYVEKLLKLTIYSKL